MDVVLKLIPEFSSVSLWVLEGEGREGAYERLSSSQTMSVSNRKTTLSSSPNRLLIHVNTAHMFRQILSLLSWCEFFACIDV